MIFCNLKVATVSKDNNLYWFLIHLFYFQVVAAAVEVEEVNIVLFKF